MGYPSETGPSLASALYILLSLRHFSSFEAPKLEGSQNVKEKVQRGRKIFIGCSYGLMLVHLSPLVLGIAFSKLPY